MTSLLLSPPQWRAQKEHVRCMRGESSLTLARSVTSASRRCSGARVEASQRQNRVVLSHVSCTPALRRSGRPRRTRASSGDEVAHPGGAEAEGEGARPDIGGISSAAVLSREDSDEQPLQEEKSALADEYSSTMQAAMGNSALTYRHELGMNYNRVLPDLIVGSCPQTPADVDTLREKEGVGAVLCLQQDSDLEYFGLDLKEIIDRTVTRGDIQHLRAEIRDFDPFSLRLELPLAVAKLHRAVREKGTAYVHCTAGMGRAPAVALAYMWWMRDFKTLEEANEVLQAVRRCGPKLFAIREALCDLLTGSSKQPVTVLWRNRGTAPQSVELAGLDVGWHNRLALSKEEGRPWWSAQRELPTGTYYFKFIIDGDKWTYSSDAPISKPDRDNNVNNYVQVVGATLSPAAQAVRSRLMEDGAVLDAEERRQVVQRIEELAEDL